MFIFLLYSYKVKVFCRPELKFSLLYIKLRTSNTNINALFPVDQVLRTNV